MLYHEAVTHWQCMQEADPEKTSERLLMNSITSFLLPFLLPCVDLQLQLHGQLGMAGNKWRCAVASR